MKNKRKIISILLSIIIIVFFPILSISKDNKNYFLDEDNNKIFRENLSNICLTPGENESMINFCWYSTNENDKSMIKIWDNEGIEKIYAGKRKKLKNGFISNKVTVEDLKENTVYYYSYKVDGIWSKPIEYKTKNPKEFIFAIMGDPQIGASWREYNSHEESIKRDTFKWNQVIKKIVEKYDNLSFIVCVGDETNTKEEIDSQAKINISDLEYCGFLYPRYLRYIPIANAIGNHDKDNKNFYNHFHMPNTSSLGKTTAGNDYYFTYGDAIFLFLNSNNLNINEHKKFIEDSLKQNENIKWKIAVFHHDIYGCGVHSNDKDIKKLRDKLPNILESNNIDLVLNGHDHIYSRTYMLKNNKTKKNFSVEKFNNSNKKIEIINNPKGITYITAGSSTGSKFYENTNKNKKYIKYKYDEKNPIYTMVKISENYMIIETYKVDGDSIIDNTIIINK